MPAPRDRGQRSGRPTIASILFEFAIFVFYDLLAEILEAFSQSSSTSSSLAGEPCAVVSNHGASRGGGWVCLPTFAA